jgi:hypothetical protein
LGFIDSRTSCSEQEEEDEPEKLILICWRLTWGGLVVDDNGDKVVKQLINGLLKRDN